jgi:hypothetical protein
MANPNPWQARLARAERRKPGSLEDMKRRTWGLLCLAYDDVGDPDPDRRRKALGAYAALGALYLRLAEQTEILPRLEALEAAILEERRQ